MLVFVVVVAMVDSRFLPIICIFMRAAADVTDCTDFVIPEFSWGEVAEVEDGLGLLLDAGEATLSTDERGLPWMIAPF